MTNKLFIVVPARKGSKRLPDKNIRLLNGIPLFNYSIKHAIALKKTFSNCQIVFSSDSDLYLSEARKIHGENVIYHHRPNDLAGDYARNIDVILGIYRDFEVELDISPDDKVLLLQPTCPIRDLEKLSTNVSSFIQRFPENDSMASFSGPHNKRDPVIWIKSTSTFTHLSIEDPIYKLHASAYATSFANLQCHKTFLAGNVMRNIVSGPELIDIDELADFSMAERLINARL